MNLDEFRMALSSDATIENEKLKSELKDLREETEREIIELKNKNEEYEWWCKQLGKKMFRSYRRSNVYELWYWML